LGISSETSFSGPGPGTIVINLFREKVKLRENFGSGPGTIVINLFREKVKLRENFGSELEPNQRTLHILKIMVCCRYIYV